MKLWWTSGGFSRTISDIKVILIGNWSKFLSLFTETIQSALKTISRTSTCCLGSSSLMFCLSLKLNFLRKFTVRSYLEVNKPAAVFMHVGMYQHWFNFRNHFRAWTKLQFEFLFEKKSSLPLWRLFFFSFFSWVIEGACNALHVFCGSVCLWTEDWEWLGKQCYPEYSSPGSRVTAPGGCGIGPALGGERMNQTVAVLYVWASDCCWPQRSGKMSKWHYGKKRNKMFAAEIGASSTEIWKSSTASLTMNR